MNDAILRMRGCTARFVAGWDFGCLPVLPAAAEDALKSIVTDLDALHLWVMKDPRLCLTLPSWMPFRDTPVPALIFREPLEVLPRHLDTRKNEEGEIDVVGESGDDIGRGLHVRVRPLEQDALGEASVQPDSDCPRAEVVGLDDFFLVTPVEPDRLVGDAQLDHQRSARADRKAGKGGGRAMHEVSHAADIEDSVIRSQ